MLDWILRIGTMFLGGGGWGSFAAILAAGGLMFILYKAYKNAQYKKAETDTKENATVENKQNVAENQLQNNQLNEDEKASQEMKNKIKS